MKNTSKWLFGAAAISLVVSPIATQDAAQAQGFFDDPFRVITRELGIDDIFGKDGVEEGSCNTSAGIGAALGGEVFGGGTLGALGGGLLGQAVCNAVRLDGVRKKDVSEVSEATEGLLKDQNSGTVTIEATNGSGRSYTIETSEAVNTQMSQEVILLEEVETPEDNSKVVTRFFTVNVNSTLNLRAGPSTQSAVTGFFNGGDIVQVMSISPDGQWALLGSLGVGVGYVSTDYLVEAPSNTNVSAVSRPNKPEDRVVSRPSTSAPASSAPSSTTPSVRRVQTVVVAPCKSVRINDRDNGTACQLSAGGVNWGRNDG